MIKWLLFILTTVFSQKIDYYVVRHGARAPLAARLDRKWIDVFGVPSEQLTKEGKSQAFYLGQELKKRHPSIDTKNLRIFSTMINRTRMTAEYFLKGWANLTTQSAIPSLNAYQFQADPRFLPPFPISIMPQPIRALVNETLNSQKIQPIPDLFYGSKRRRQPRTRPPLTRELRIWQLETQRLIEMTNICQKLHNDLKPICQQNADKVQNYFSMSDVLNCLQIRNQSLQGLTPTDINYVHAATDLVYNGRFGPKATSQDFAQNFLSILQQTISNQAPWMTVEFNHDVFIFAVVRMLSGYQNFIKVFEPHLIIPFLTTLHFSVKLPEKTVEVKLNGKKVPILGCPVGDCPLDVFRNVIRKHL